MSRFKITGVADLTLQLSPGTLPNGSTYSAYNQTVVASGGAPPYTYAVTSGALPTGLSLNTSTGAITGTPTVTSTGNFTITATDAANNQGKQSYSVQVVVDVNSYINKLKTVENASLIDIWPLNEASGTVANDAVASARNGAYVNTPTLANQLFQDGVNSEPLFTAASLQYVNVFSSSLASAFSAAQGTILVWIKFSSAEWALVTARRFVDLFVNASNEVLIDKNGANSLRWLMTAGGTTSLVALGSQSSTNWLPLVITWNKASNRLRAYISGSQTGTDQTLTGVWAGSLAQATVAAANGPSTYMQGNLGMVALWTIELTAAEVATISAAP
jgi:large repetitive protein